MKKKLVVASMLVLFFVFSAGPALAQIGEDNFSQMGNFSTERDISTLDNKTVNISQQPGGDVRWILPGERRLDPSIFGTPQAPLGFEPIIGVPVENRSISKDGMEFTTTMDATPFSDNYQKVNGTFYMNLTDRTPVDVKQSKDAATAVFRFTDPTGNVRYGVILRNLTRVGQGHPVFGGVVIDGVAHGRTAIDTRLVPTSYVYGAFWGIGDLYVNGTLVSRNRVIHAMATESLRSSDNEGYKLLFDNQLPHAGIEAELLLPDMIMSENGTMQKEPVPTNYTLPDGQEQPFIHVAFEDSRIKGLPILDFNNTTVNLIGKMAGNVTENKTTNQTEGLIGAQNANVTETQSGSTAETQAGTITGTQTQNTTQTETGSLNQTQSGSLTQSETGNFSRNQ